MDLADQIHRTAASIRSHARDFQPQVGIILGSGLGALADRLRVAVRLPYDQLPHFPTASVPGHAGRLVLGELGDQRVVAMQGRVHFYEGYSPAQVVFPARVLCALGIRTLVVTNAAGGIRQDLAPGTLMAISDHLNLSGFNPLWGPNDDRLGPRFPDLSAAYHPGLIDRLVAAGAQVGVEIKRGVYAMMAGPAYETPAEIRALQRLGADAVGMSTVPEVVAARHMGVQVVGLSCITNRAAGLSAHPLSHQEVAHTAAQVADAFARAVERFLPDAGTV